MNYLVEALGLYGLIVGMMEMMQGGILNKWGDFIDTLPVYLSKPLGRCLQCFGTWVVILFAITSMWIDLTVILRVGLFYFIIELFKEKEKLR